MTTAPVDRNFWNCRASTPHRQFGTRERCETCGVFRDEADTFRNESQVRAAIDEAVAAFAARLASKLRAVALTLNGEGEAYRALEALAEEIEP
jgi:wyosine [tRNA(Phe)-imidazoG37] synthetase (radical SAM superfamily)